MANQKLNAIITIGASMNASVRKTLGGLSGALGRVGDEISTITKRQRELDKQRKVLERQGQSVEELDREYQQLGQTLDKLRQKQERLNKISDGLGKVGAAAGNAFKTVAGQATIAAAAIGVVGAATFGLADNTAHTAREVARLSKISGASTEEFQRMAFAAESVGIEQDKMADILKDMNDRVGDFLQTGGGPMADFFEKIAPKVGVTAENFRNLSGPDALQLFVSSLEKANLSQAEMTFYMEAIASDSTALLPLLRDNGREMDRLADSAESVGRVLDETTIRASQEYGAAMRDAKGAMEGVKTTIGTALIPVVTDLAREFTAFVKDNRPQIEEFARSMGQAFRDALPVIGQVVEGLGTVAGAIGDVLSFVADLLGGWDNLGIAVGTAFVAPSIISIGKLGASLVGLIAATGPIGLVIAAVAAAAVLIVANWDTIRDSALAAWGALKDGAKSATDWVVRKFRYLAAKVNALMQPIRDTLKWVGDGVDAVGKWWNSGDGPAEGTTGIVMDPTSTAPGVNQYAKGGPMMPGAALVGEQGPELIFPSRSGYVATARQTAQMMGGGGRQVNVGGITINAAPGMDPRAIADAVMARLQAAERSAMYDGVMA